MTHPEYLEVSRYPPLVMGLRWVWFHICELVTAASLLANFLPNAKRFEGRPRLHWCYAFLVHYVAFFALNFRHCLPSLDLEFLGFRRMRRRFERQGL